MTTLYSTPPPTDGPFPNVFEGPEKLLEIWFKPNYSLITPSCSSESKPGLRAIPSEEWEPILDLVHCKVLNIIRNDHVDAYLLSESSMFVYPHKLILKTCGTTTLLFAIPRILQIAEDRCHFNEVWSVFYSRKNFMFPQLQTPPHHSWEEEVEYLNNVFGSGSSYVVGKTNSDHWHLYMTSPGLNSPPRNEESKFEEDDITIEILMTELGSKSAATFEEGQYGGKTASEGGKLVETATKIDQIYPSAQSDSFLFSPCGFSLNGLVDSNYFTIHVTPQEEFSYASFESNVPLEYFAKNHPCENPLNTLIDQVTRVFQPGKFTVTVFRSTHSLKTCPLSALDFGILSDYRKIDRIMYEFDSHVLHFGHFVRHE